KLPGDRKPVFPEGVPGVAQGIPPDLMKGNQPQPENTGATPRQATATPATRQATAAPEEFTPAPREKAKAKVKAKPKPAVTEETPPAPWDGRGGPPPPAAEGATAAATATADRRFAVAGSAASVAHDDPAGRDAVAGPAADALIAFGVRAGHRATFATAPAPCMSFTVAIVGRPNVGKSTLFNRLVGRRLALVDDLPGVPRDRREGAARLGDLAFTAIDTAGLEEAALDSLTGRMQAQTEAAIAAADAVFFLIDARTGPTPVDRAFADLVRRSGKPTILVANKSESRAAEAGVLEAYALGLGEPVAISAEHGEGLADLYDALRQALPEETAGPASGTAGELARPLQVAVVGRPNSGKSTLVNRLIGEERLLTGPEAGITRDAIAVDLDWRGRRFRLHDTAGLRRRA